MKRPNLRNWRTWSWHDYLAYFLCSKAAILRARRADISVMRCISERDVSQFCAPIRDRLSRLYLAPCPEISIQIPTRNDESELLATLVSYAQLDVDPGKAELIVCNNNCTDSTAQILHHCGVKTAFCDQLGIGPARKAAYDAMSPSVEYVWLTDCDVRVTAPLRKNSDVNHTSTVFRTVMGAFANKGNLAGVSTGWKYEWTHPVFRIIQTIAISLKQAPKIRCWSGPMQVWRRNILDAIGGIHEGFSHRDRDDFQRFYEVARYAKIHGYDIVGASQARSLYDPVYHSGRNRGTLKDVVKAVCQGRHHAPRLRDRFGFPVDPRDRIKA